MDNAFSLAYALIASKTKEFVIRGIHIFTEILISNQQRWRECKFFIALGNLYIGNYDAARMNVNDLLSVEPNNMQALALKTEIDKKSLRGMP